MAEDGIGRPIYEFSETQFGAVITSLLVSTERTTVD